MIEFYAQIKLVHVAAALTSGGLFLLRGLAVQGGSGWPMTTPLRYLSYGIDIVLLSAALTLVAILPSAVFANGWLWAKLGLLVFYIVLGSFALKRAQTPRVRFACYVAALLAFGAMYSIARTHDPLGALSDLLA
jgi:uncharacterized membrane protein SirB2